jgi:hypothetical protein
VAEIGNDLAVEPQRQAETRPIVQEGSRGVHYAIASALGCGTASPYTKRDMSQTIYPDVTNILARKKEGRREISRRSLGEKIAMVEALRERLSSEFVRNDA